ncbi:MAG: hypothetical protein LBK62_12830 [Treponema sp.]|jgi:hypothetical protein|nr:hypothetical protein [Treponema sp.]
MNKKSGKRLFFGFITLIALMMGIGTGCPTGGGSDSSGGASIAATPQTLEYRSVDPDGNIYQLLITETLSGAKYAAKQGDKYVLTITLIGPPAGTKTSSGTVSNAGVTLTLRPANASGTITVQISGEDLSGITIGSTVKDDTNAALATSNAPITLAPVPPADVLIAGFDNDKPCYWLNGVKHDLTFTGSGKATAIAVSGGKVYIAGHDDDGPCYWIDGVKQSLPITESSGRALGIAVSGSDVHIVGAESISSVDKACYWLNGTKTPLPLAVSDSRASTITVSGSDVHITGDNYGTACYWFNGAYQSLPDTPNTAYSFAGAIAVSGGKVYIVGLEQDKITYNFTTPCYWIDGVKQQTLPFTGIYGSAYAIAVSGGKVYIAGVDSGTPCYWIDGVKQSLPITELEGRANGIAVSGSDVCIPGYENSTSVLKPCYWFNGKKQSLPYNTAGTGGEANAIALR